MTLGSVELLQLQETQTDDGELVGDPSDFRDFLSVGSFISRFTSVISSGRVLCLFAETDEGSILPVPILIVDSSAIRSDQPAV